MNPLNIIPAIYTYDHKSSVTNTTSVLEYEAAFEQALFYKEQGADGLYILDISVNHERKKNLIKFLKHLSSEVNIPLVIGGGIHSVKDVGELLNTGVEKVTVNSAAVKNPELIANIIKEFGKEKLLIGIDSKKSFGEWKVYLNGAKSRTEIDLNNWIKMCKIKGVQELVITLIPRKNESFDEYPIDVLREAIDGLGIPVHVAIGNLQVNMIIDIVKIEGVASLISGTYFLNKPGVIRQVKSLLNGSDEFHQAN
ncbi:MAG: HisA/HisF-related TIM barrel protein [Flavobacteriales bacterium]